MIKNDLAEIKRLDDRNALEEYVYDVHRKMQKNGELGKNVSERNCAEMCKYLEDLKIWLDTSENCTSKEYKQKLDELKKKIDPIKGHQSNSVKFP